MSARLSAAHARTVYALADAWWPPAGDPAGPRGGGDIDVAPDVEAALARLPSRERRGLLRWLAWVEWLPRATRAGRHGFAWLPREARARWLERMGRSAFPPLRRGAAAWRRLVDGACAPRLGPPGQSSPPGA